jgi:hypothetical protein
VLQNIAGLAGRKDNTMQNDVTVPYLGAKIVLDEDANLWKCDEVGYQNVSLKKVRKRVEQHRSQQRAAQAVSGFFIGKDGAGQVLECEILRYIGLRSPWVGDDGQPKVQATWNTPHADKPVKRDTNLSEIVADTPENRAVLDEAAALRKQAYDLIKQATAKVGALPRMTVEDIPEMVAQFEKERDTAGAA